MDQAAVLIEGLKADRFRLMELVGSLSDEQAEFKRSAEEWSINENLEHLWLAEVSGVSKIWSAAEGVRKGKPVWSGEHTNRGLSIEEIIDLTWKPREAAPPISMPHIGGPLSYWMEGVTQMQGMVESLKGVLGGLDLETVIFPHFLCGPLDAGQRLDFLRFHMERHRQQIRRLLGDAAFPIGG